jgi:hypothetical protein
MLDACMAAHRSAPHASLIIEQTCCCLWLPLKNKSSRKVLLCYWCAVPCCAMPCHAMPCHDIGDLFVLPCCAGVSSSITALSSDLIRHNETHLLVGQQDGTVSVLSVAHEHPR